MIGVWVTNHEISRIVGNAIYDSLKPIFPDTELCLTVPEKELKCIADINIGYGILRNMDAVWRKSKAENKPYFIIDRGYWKPGHYDGYYRVSLGGTQQTFGFDKLEPDYARWDALGIEILSGRAEERGPILLCPPSDYVLCFFSVNKWFESNADKINPWMVLNNKLWRHKSCERRLQDDLNKCSTVYTFNSSVGWEALRQGIPVISDPTHSIIGSYVNHFSKSNDISFASEIHKDVNMRRRLFAVMAGLQLTLNEIRSGQLWPILLNLLSVT